VHACFGKAVCGWWSYDIGGPLAVTRLLYRCGIRILISYYSRFTSQIAHTCNIPWRQAPSPRSSYRLASSPLLPCECV